MTTNTRPRSPNQPPHHISDIHLSPVAGISGGRKDAKDGTIFKVGIVGAGAAGLFTAMIFDHLKEKYNLNVTYEILEAEAKRYGGRLYTYNFPQRQNQPPVGPHDYYDVGAMRFSQARMMKRTFQLFKALNMNFVDPKKVATQQGDLIPCYPSGPNQPTLYNGIQLVQQDGVPALSAATFQIPGIPSNIANKSAAALAGDCISNLRKLYFERGADALWKKLLQDVDSFSVRQYLATQANFDPKTLESLETLDSAPGLYDQAASEMVLISLGFEANASWHCVEGGAFEIARRMKSALRNPNAVELGKVVTGMSYTNASDPKQGQVAVTVSGEAKQRTYEAVFNSAPLGAIHKMQLEGLELDWGTKLAIRNLSYGGSCKIAVRFRTLWWMQNGLDITRGGQSHSDLPIRCCVYPSYNIYDDPTKPGVLLVSYTYYQDAERMGALISRQAAENEPLIKELVIHDLARLHAKTGDESDYERLRHIIADNWLDYHAYNWHQNPFSVGAVAYFRPGQFSGLYSSLTQSDGRHVIIGEAASAHHAWMVGALESAVRGVYQFVHAHRTDSAAAAAATLDFEHNNIPGPFGPLPAEFNRT